MALPPFCLLFFPCLGNQIVDLFVSEYFSKQRIVLILLPQDAVLLFEPVIAPSQTFIIPVYGQSVKEQTERVIQKRN